MKKRSVFILRHASPNLELKNIVYNVPPGPPLSAKGEEEAQQLADFLKSQGVVKIYHSPLVRTKQTAQIISSLNQIPAVEEQRLAEWLGPDKPGEIEGARVRMKAAFDAASEEAVELGPIGLVSHGGPIDVLLQELGIRMDELAIYRTKFDHSNPLPPAGVWQAKRDSDEEPWTLELVFTPK